MAGPTYGLADGLGWDDHRGRAGPVRGAAKGVRVKATGAAIGDVADHPHDGLPAVLLAEEPFELLIESVTEYAIFLLSPAGVVSTWNRGAERIKGYGAEDIIGEHFSIFYPPEAVAAGLPAHELAVAADVGRYEDEGWRIRKDGTRLWANVVITALRGRDGRLLGFGKVTRDMTERRAVEAELQRAYAQRNAVLESTSNGVLTISHDWVMLYGNRRTLGTIPDFHIGRNYWEHFPTVIGTAVEHALRRTMSERLETHFEYFFDLYKTWFRVAVFPVDEGLSIFFTDITEEKKMQEQLELERELREKRIEALSHMAGGLAHEISNPLAIIHARASDLLRESELTECLAVAEVQEGCRSIVQTSDRAMRILRGLRGFGRAAGNDPMEPAAVEAIVEECLEMQHARFERHKVRLQVDIDPGLPPIVCREVQIGQILTNLLNNAFDAIVHANCVERWIRIEARRVEDAIQIDVTDSGSGIDDKFKAHVMEPFFTTKEFGVGTGVGLSLSRAMALEHGGTLQLCEGTERTRFRLVLPIETEGWSEG